MKKICIISSFRNENECLNIFINEIDKAFSKHSNLDYRILFVDDYSTDNSKQTIINKIKDNKKISLISFKKNYGASPSIFFAFQNVREGEYATVIDCDMQDPITLIPETLEKADDKTLYHFVREARHEKNKFQLFYTHIAYKLINFVSGGKIIMNTNYFKIIPPFIIKKIQNEQRDKYPYWNYFITKFSDRNERVFYHRQDRVLGVPKFGIFSMNPWVTFYSSLAEYKIRSLVMFLTSLTITIFFYHISQSYSLLHLMFKIMTILQIINLFFFIGVMFFKKFQKEVKFEFESLNL